MDSTEANQAGKLPDSPLDIQAGSMTSDEAAPETPDAELERLRAENSSLRSRLKRKTQYIRDKTNSLLAIMGTAQVADEELDDDNLLEVDPLGVIFEYLGHVLANLKGTNAQLHMVNEETSAIFAAVDVGIMVVDRNMHMISCNSKIREMFPESEGRFIPGASSCYDAICQGSVPDELCSVKRVLAGAGIARLRDWQFNGRHFDVVATPIREMDGSVNSVVVVYNDITELKQAEENRLHFEQQMMHSKKLESVGMLAGGIAHEFNNILMAVIGNANLAMMKLDKENPAMNNLCKVEQAANKAAGLARQMLEYSGKGKVVVERLDLNRLLEDVRQILEISISRKAVLTLHLTDPLPPVEADPAQMRQIIMNLVINASEALGDNNGEISISTGSVWIDRDCPDDFLPDEVIDTGTYIFLEVSDTGCGMDRETMAKLFDPFFSTKFIGRGLGLPAAQGIIRGHKGTIRVWSEPGAGSRFRVLLPAAAGE